MKRHQAAIIEHPRAKGHPQANVFNLSLKIVHDRAKEYTPVGDTRVIAAMEVIKEYLNTHGSVVEDTDVADKDTAN